MPGKMNYPYRKGVDIPAWVLQFIACLILIGISAAALVVVEHVDETLLNDDFDSDYDSSFDDWDSNYRRLGKRDTVDDVQTLLRTAAGISIAIGLITIILNIVEIVLIARKRMPPALYLSSVCIKSAIWLAVFIVEAIPGSIGGIIISIVVVITCFIQLGFGASIVHKKRKGAFSGGSYQPAVNPSQPDTEAASATHSQPQPYGSGPQEPQQMYGAHSQQSYGAAPEIQPYSNTMYAPHMQPGTEKPHDYSYTSPAQQYPSQTPPPQHQQQAYPAPAYGYGSNSYELNSR
ncbi:hypothetical protein GGS20DRAFT_569873 [Poronia punctata]|nr:hypothetical protein GGS20DRAFT_569873 [Poronia punctata]